MSILNKKAMCHIFISTSQTKETSHAYEVTKYSIESLASISVNFIPILNEEYIHVTIPTICKNLGLKGVAIFVKEGYLCKEDILKLIEELNKDKRCIWVIKRGVRFDDWHDFVVYNLNLDVLYKKLPSNAFTYKDIYKRRFGFINTGHVLADRNIGEIDEMWAMKPYTTETPIKYTNIKGIDFSDTQPWVNKNTKFARDWFKEFKLYILNVLLPEVNSSI